MMTLEEALEYLNLPANCRSQLVRKRYLELKKDYLRAIYNAPSDHFSTLYQENLQKIEDAYHFLTGEVKNLNEKEFQIQQTIEQIQQLVDTLHSDQKVLDFESQKILEVYIDRIDQLKDTISQGNLGAQLQIEPSNGPAWHWEVGQIKKAEPGVSVEPLSGRDAQRQTGFLKTLIDYALGAPSKETSGARKHLYDRILMGIILCIVILGILGTLYVMSPLLFN